MLKTTFVLSALALAVAAQQPVARILLYTATTRYRHDSIPAAIEALQSSSSSINVLFDNTEDLRVFTEDNLNKYDAVAFLSTSGDDILGESGEAALQAYLNKGGNFIGIHSASDTLRNTSFFVREVGSQFDYHPELQHAAYSVIGPPHPSTAHLPSPWVLNDEIYNFKLDPRAVGATVILTVDRASYNDNATESEFDHGDPHPIVWYQERGAGVEEGGISGRSWYTGLGHVSETWKDPVFMQHILSGVQWALHSNLTKAYNATGLVGNSDLTLSASKPTGGSSPVPSDEASDESRANRFGVPFALAAALASVANVFVY